jgi:multisite-specific tRNA:(cytosine-C5)-methyltransferase
VQFSKGGRGGGNGGGAQRRDWQDFPRSNERFENYYNSQDIIPEEEREIFWETLRKDLPNSFRFTGSKGYVTSRRISAMARDADSSRLFYNFRYPRVRC